MTRLSDAQIAILADDAMVVAWWTMRMRIKRPNQAEHVAKALKLRLAEFAGGPKVEDIVRAREAAE
jgi:hypothetical protein